MSRYPKWGEFCEVFGANPRNRVIEFFLECRELEFSIGDVARETGLNRATAYIVMAEIVKKRYLMPTRKSSGAQLYKLNIEKEEVALLIKAFNLVLSRVVEEEMQKYDKTKHGKTRKIPAV
ncbi:hypothetical protein HYU15_00030 [Candidatus Woesearchaeota archaeon]|nr:hypothetical protein [Candidatus Woesearchaeota archaeon]